ncbi:hypothetical protein [uncultured Clostridium sp.]|uniref:hypothetical protein n=1 Tax=uncultured Clostridium sp. TaxID=59620 RepID=UPI00261F4AAE|nr:hypothetical protein [uncultured Clostridium sp.]
MDCICVEYGSTFPKLTKDLLENEADVYHGALIALRVKELTKHSAGFKKISKITNDGSKIKFVIIHTKEEALEAIESLNEDIKKYNEKFGKEVSTVSLIED